MANLVGWITHVINFINGFRKFTIMLLLIIIAVAFRLSDHISGEELVNLLQGTAIAFFSANGVEHMTAAVKEWVKGKVAK